MLCYSYCGVSSNIILYINFTLSVQGRTPPIVNDPDESSMIIEFVKCTLLITIALWNCITILNSAVPSAHNQI